MKEKNILKTKYKDYKTDTTSIAFWYRVYNHAQQICLYFSSGLWGMYTGMYKCIHRSRTPIRFKNTKKWSMPQARILSEYPGCVSLLIVLNMVITQWCLHTQQTPFYSKVWILSYLQNYIASQNFAAWEKLVCKEMFYCFNNDV